MCRDSRNFWSLYDAPSPWKKTGSVTVRKVGHQTLWLEMQRIPDGPSPQGNGAHTPGRHPLTPLVQRWVFTEEAWEELRGEETNGTLWTPPAAEGDGAATGNSGSSSGSQTQNYHVTPHPCSGGVPSGAEGGDAHVCLHMYVHGGAIHNIDKRRQSQCPRINWRTSTVWYRDGQWSVPQAENKVVTPVTQKR